jgi:hypothetical protein
MPDNYLTTITRLDQAYSHTRFLRIFTIICHHAAAQGGKFWAPTELERVSKELDSSLPTLYRQGKVYSARSIYDHLQVCQALDIFKPQTRRVYKSVYYLTDYGIAIYKSSTSKLITMSLSEREKFLYLYLILRKDLFSVQALVAAFRKYAGRREFIMKVLSNRKSDRLEDLRNYFSQEAERLVATQTFGLERFKTLKKISHAKTRTLNHRISSLVFWLVQILCDDPFPSHVRAQDNVREATICLKRMTSLSVALGKFSGGPRKVQDYLDRNYVGLFRSVFGWKIKDIRRVKQNKLEETVSSFLHDNWNDFAQFQPPGFRSRINALAFLLCLQSYFLVNKKWGGNLLEMVDVIGRAVASRSYVLSWRGDFHSGYIEKLG